MRKESTLKNIIVRFSTLLTKRLKRDKRRRTGLAKLCVNRKMRRDVRL